MSVLRYSRGVLQVIQECFLFQVFFLVVSQGTSWKFRAVFMDILWMLSGCFKPFCSSWCVECEKGIKVLLVKT